MFTLYPMDVTKARFTPNAVDMVSVVAVTCYP